MRVAGKYAYVADEGNGLVIIEVSNPQKLSQVGRYAASGKVYDVHIEGGYGYLVVGDKGFEVVNISNVSNPSNISRISLVDTPGNAASIYVQGNHAYVADGENGIVVIDVSKPTQPRIVHDSPWINEIRSVTF